MGNVRTAGGGRPAPIKDASPPGRAPTDSAISRRACSRAGDFMSRHVQSIVAVHALAASCGWSSEPCAEPLEAYCVDCATFDEAFADAAAIDPVADDRYVAAYECGENHRAIAIDTSWYMGQTRYFASATGELVGVESWTDVLKTCDRSRTLTTVYGDVPDCEGTCLLLELCADETSCTSNLPPCEP